MTRFVVPLLLGLAVLALVIASGVASNPDELRDRAADLKQRAAELASDGKLEEAEQHRREAREVLEALDRRRQKEIHHQVERKIDEHREQLERLRDEFKRVSRSDEPARAREQLERDILETEKRLGQLERERRHHGEREEHHHGERAEHHHGNGEEREHRHPRHEEEEHADAARRIGHIRRAAENLNEAGMHEMAEDLFHRAEEMERELHREAGGERGPELRELHELVNDLRAQLRELRNEIRELRELVHKRLDD